MTDSRPRTVLLRPTIPTDGRPILPNGGPSSVLFLALCLVPAIAIAIAVVDTRSGFQLFMGSLAATMSVLIVALYFRMRGLRAGAIRIDAEGGLRFAPPRSHRVSLIAVPLSLLLPVAAMLSIRVLDLPTQASSSRLMAAMPFVLTAVAAGSLALVAWSMRVPAGLRVSEHGLVGVRGSKPVDLGWDDILGASPAGQHGPRLRVRSAAGGDVIIDCHHTGSDPAVVAAVIEFYRLRAALRRGLGDGRAAIQAVETGVRPK